MSDDFEVAIRVRLTVHDPDLLIAAAGEGVPAVLSREPLMAMQSALQALVPLPGVDDLPGVRVWRGLGPSASVSAQPWDANANPEG